MKALLLGVLLSALLVSPASACALMTTGHNSMTIAAPMHHHSDPVDAVHHADSQPQLTLDLSIMERPSVVRDDACLPPTIGDAPCPKSIALVRGEAALTVSVTVIGETRIVIGQPTSTIPESVDSDVETPPPLV